MVSDINIPGSPGTAMAIAAAIVAFSAARYAEFEHIGVFLIALAASFGIATVYIEIIHTQKEKDLIDKQIELRKEEITLAKEHKELREKEITLAKA